MYKPAPLPGFEYVRTYAAVRNWLWPDTPSSVITEPARLAEVIDTVAPDDRWLVDADVSEPAITDDDRPADVRYIDLSRRPELLEFSQLLVLENEFEGKGTFIIRDEYRCFVQHALSLSLHPSPVRIFAAGHSGIGNSLGAHYFLLYFLGLGKPLFWVQDNRIYYFDAHGIQCTRSSLRDDREVLHALKASYVLIDMDLETSLPDPSYRISKVVLWTSSPSDSRWQYFCKRFPGCKRWFMKPWSTKEIAATADRLGCAHDQVIARMTWCGPVARDLFQGDPQTDQHVNSNIVHALSATFGVDDRVFLVRPAVVMEDFGGRRLVREDFVSGFLTPAMAVKTAKIAVTEMNWLQPRLSQALCLSSACLVAGSLVEGVMHRSLTSGRLSLPAIFGGGRVAATLELLGQADVFTPKGAPSKKRPVYLRPLASFPTVNAIVVTTPKQLGLLQTSFGDVDTTAFGTMLSIIERLTIGAGVDVRKLEDIVYCIVGIGGDAYRVQNLVREARAALAQLKELDKLLQLKFSEPAGKMTDPARARTRMFRVVGVIFDPEMGFMDVTRD
ncbi:hypothetical protein DFH06DRAFT_590840 [Mycena polygramma]|nr:hypothetical protein DFH06DRAFT_590840 [Mycena polygramma]